MSMSSGNKFSCSRCGQLHEERGQLSSVQNSTMQCQPWAVLPCTAPSTGTAAFPCNRHDPEMQRTEEGWKQAFLLAASLHQATTTTKRIRTGESR